MKILLTGAAGFVGSHLAGKLIENHKIVGIDNFDPFYDRDVKDGNVLIVAEKSAEIFNRADNVETEERFKFIEGDCLDSEFLEGLFFDHKFDAIIHVAAKAGVRPSIKTPVEYVRNNVEATVNLLEFSRQNLVENFVFASSSSIYGAAKKVPFSETDFVDNPISPYAASKKSCELFCYNYSYLYKMKIACLRLFTVYGPRQRPDLAIAKFVRLITEGEPIPVFGDGSTERDYTYVDDIVSGFDKALNWLIDREPGTCEVFNIGNNRTVKLSYLIETLESALGKKAEIDRLPMQPGDVPRTYADISKAKAAFGYDPKTTIEEGVRKYVESEIR